MRRAPQAVSPCVSVCAPSLPRVTPLCRGAQPDTIDYSVIVSTCAKAGAWQRALEFFDEMQAKGLVPDVIARNSAISACAKGMDWRRALQILRQMRPDGVEPNQAHRFPSIYYIDYIGGCSLPFVYLGGRRLSLYTYWPPLHVRI